MVKRFVTISLSALMMLGFAALPASAFCSYPQMPYQSTYQPNIPAFGTYGLGTYSGYGSYGGYGGYYGNPYSYGYSYPDLVGPLIQNTLNYASGYNFLPMRTNSYGYSWGY